MHGAWRVFGVSTHSRPRAAGRENGGLDIGIAVSTHSRPRAAGLSGWGTAAYLAYVSTHSRPRAAGIQLGKEPLRDSVSTHSRPRAAGSFVLISINRNKFQHTAARGRLDLSNDVQVELLDVSTHSRPRAAGG